MLKLDHIAVAGETLQEAAAYCEGVLRTALQQGGVHETFGTHNQLIGLAPHYYLEAIAVDPSAPQPDRPRWFGLDDFQGAPMLSKWICQVEDLDAAIRALPMAGERVDLTRGNLSWSMAVPASGHLPFDGLFPALIQWHSAVHPGKTLQGSGLTLQKLEVAHPKAAMLQSILEPLMDDPLVDFQNALAPALRAQIDTGDGAVWLV